MGDFLGILLGVFLGVLLDGPALSAASTPLPPRYSLEELDSAAGFLLRAADADSPGKYCGIDGARARTLLRALHPRVDQSAESWIQGVRARPDGGRQVVRDRLRDCERGCHCGAYATALDRAGHLSPAEQDAIRRLNAKAARISQARLGHCALRASQWFCDGPLMRDLEAKAAGSY